MENLWYYYYKPVGLGHSIENDLRKSISFWIAKQNVSIIGALQISHPYDWITLFFVPLGNLGFA